jgi:hypothetical protein
MSVGGISAVPAGVALQPKAKAKAEEQSECRTEDD